MTDETARAETEIGKRQEARPRQAEPDHSTVNPRRTHEYLPSIFSNGTASIFVELKLIVDE